MTKTAIRTTSGVVMVEAIAVYGQWAVHQSVTVGDPAGFRVSNTESGLAAVHMLTSDEAVAVARHLSDVRFTDSETLQLIRAAESHQPMPEVLKTRMRELKKRLGGVVRWDSDGLATLKLHIVPTEATTT